MSKHGQDYNEQFTDPCPTCHGEGSVPKEKEVEESRPNGLEVIGIATILMVTFICLGIFISVGFQIASNLIN